MSDSGRTLAEMLCEVGAVTFAQEAQIYRDLRDRLGPDALSVDEWNALCSAATYAHVEAERKKRDKITYSDDMRDLLRESRFLVARLREHEEDQGEFQAHVLPSVARMEMILEKLGRYP